MIAMCLVCIFVVCLSLFCLSNPARAGIAWSGDVIPADPGTWTSSTSGYIGFLGSGVLNITSDSDVLDQNGFIGGYTSGAAGEVTVDGTGSTWTNSTDLTVGFEGSGVLNITNGGAVSVNYMYGYSYIGRSSGATGEVTVDGAGSTWTNSGLLYVGLYGGGALNITGGGAVSSSHGRIAYESGSTGEVTVDGPGSTWTNSDDLYVGGHGSGVLGITSGGALSSFRGFIGYKSGATSVVTVNGPGATWTNSLNLYVGDEGSGVLDIMGGGVVSSFRSFIGHFSGATGEVTVDGPGATWTNRGVLYVGDEGGGVLNITNGGAVSNSDGYIAGRPGSSGVVTVDGSDSIWTSSGGLYIGGDKDSTGGTGELTVSSGGTVEVNYYTLRVYNSGTLNLTDGQVTTKSFDNTAGGTFNFTGGSMTIDGGAFYPGTSDFTLDGTGNPMLILINGATMNIGGTLTVGGTNTAALTLNRGSVTVGSFDNTTGGVFNWTNGAFRFSNSLTIDSVTPFNAAGANGDQITASRTLEVANNLTIGGSGALTLNGGSITAGSFDNTTGGVFNWTSGTLRFSDSLTIDSATPFNAAGADGDKITASRTLEVANNLTIGSNGALTLNGESGTAR